jgi:hypothetical protein
MIKLSKLLDLDSKPHHPAAIADCLGDSYLCRNNIVHEKIRARFLELGGRFRCDESELCEDYRVAPLYCLRDIIESATVPYNRNAAACRRMVARNPGFALSGAHLVDTLRRNVILHETAHCLLDLCVPPAPGAGRSSAAEEFVLRSLISESFANAAERVAWALAQTPTHMLFFSLHTTYIFDRPRHEMLGAAIARWGYNAVFRLAFHVFYFYNTRGEPDPRPPTEEILEATFGHEPLTPAERAGLRDLAEQAFMLNAGFRQNTTPTYFRLHGVEDVFLNLSNSPNSHLSWQRLAGRELVDTLGEVVGDHSYAAAATPAPVH